MFKKFAYFKRADFFIGDLKRNTRPDGCVGTGQGRPGGQVAEW